MPTNPVIDEEPNRKRIRLGLAFLALVVLVSLVMVFLVDAPAGKAVMLVIAGFTIVRTFMLVRTLRAAR